MSIPTINERPARLLGYADDVGSELQIGDPAASAPSSLSQLTDAASLSALVPRLQAALAEIAGPGGNVLDSLSRNVESLQDGFLETLYGALSEAGINLNEKLTLRAGAASALCVVGEHPQKELIEEELRQHPELSAAFAEIASQSELLRDITNIGKVMSRQSGAEQYAGMADHAGTSVYQMSLKGDMSHFYFGRPA